MLVAELEDDLVHWSLAIQKQGLTVVWETIIQNYQEIHGVIYGSMRSVGSIVRVWCDQVMNQHQELLLLCVQIIKQVRN